MTGVQADAVVNVPLSGGGCRHGLPSDPASHWLLHPQAHLSPPDEGMERLSEGK